jgi:dTDP-4-dehydrorhamnose 3,5-epimerase-like enzyme
MERVDLCKVIPLRTIHRPEGDMVVIEGTKDVPFDIKRSYYLYNVPDGCIRGGHAHKNLFQLLVAVSGSFRIILKDGSKMKVERLYKPDEGLIIVPGIWRELDFFSEKAVCMVYASRLYDESDYIRNYEDFLSYKRQYL